MKILRTILIAILVLMMGMSAAFAANIEDIAYSIEWNIGFGKYPVALDWKWHYMTQTPCTEAEWEQACALAIQHAKADGSWERMDPWGEAEDDPMTLHGQFYDPSANSRTGSTTPGDLGDESVPMYILCAAAAVTLGGVIFANKKRVCA